MNVPHPGYTSTKPLIEPIALMYKELGDQDACFQLQELAVRYLEKCAEEMGEGRREFLSELYKGSDIPHGAHVFDKLRAVAGTSYLLVTYALFEKMIKGCIHEYKEKYPRVRDKWTNMQGDKQLAPLERITFNALPEHRRQLISPPEYKLLEYYRLARVSGAHVDQKTLEKAEKAFRTLSTDDMSHFREYSKIASAPNPPGSIGFEDFNLYTRSIKYYSNVLNEVCG